MRISPTLKTFLLLGLLGLIIYSPSFNSGFHWDDIVFIVNNPDIRNVFDIKTIWNTNIPGRSRFVALYTFAWNYHFFQANAFGYHVTNFLIHIASAMLVWWFVKMILPLSTPRTTDRKKPVPIKDGTIAFLAALVFLAHPVQTQAISYITQRFESLAAFFYILSLCLYVKGRLSQERRAISIGSFAGSVVAAVLGMLTKEIVITLPITIMLVEFAFLRKEQEKGGPRKVHRWVMIPMLLPILVVPALFSFNLYGMSLPRTSLSHIGDVLTFGTYILTQFRVMGTFLRLLFVPLNQNLDYDFPMSTSLIDPASTLVCLLLLGGILWVGITLFKRDRLMAFCIFWFFIVLAPNFWPRQYVIFEHKLYLVTLGFSILVAVGLARVFKDHKKYVMVVSAIILVLSFLTFERNKVWSSSFSLWRDTVKKSPHKGLPHHNLGAAYAMRGDYEQALWHFTRSIEMDPKFKTSYSYRGNMYMNMGRPDLALKDYERALSIDRYYAEASFNLGVLYQQQGEFDLALQNYDRATLINRRYLKAYNNRSMIYRDKGQFEKALAEATTALQIAPRATKLYFARGTIYEAMKRDEAALAEYNKALSVNPIYQPAYFNRAELHRRLKRYSDALADYEKAIAFQPNNIQIYFQRGLTYIMMQKYEEALRDYDRILAIKPDFYLAHYQKANIYMMLNEKDLAEQEFAIIRELTPPGTIENIEQSRLEPLPDENLGELE